MTTFWLSAVILLVSTATAQGQLPDHIRDEIHSHKEDAQRILDYIQKGEGRHAAHRRLAELADRFGPRFTGSQALEDSIDYLMEKLRDEGFENVRGEPFEVNQWLRGDDSITMVLPRHHKMDLLALGSSIGTPSEGITADAIVVRSFEELEENKDSVPGKIVVYNQPWAGYGESVAYRSRGAADAAKHGGLAAVVRSVTPHSLYTTHTGSQRYDANYTQVPAVAITVEDAELLQRIQDRGQRIQLQLVVKSGTANVTATTRNVVGELRGAKYPHQSVSFGGHVDSWDVGTGVMDDGNGVVISWQVLSIMKALGLTPKRTMRNIYWSAEEIGVVGAAAYYEKHKDDNGNMSLIMEADSGTFTPRGVGFTGSGMARAIMEEIVSALLPSINATEVGPNGGQADTGVWIRAGVPGASLLNRNQDYFHYHHSRADTITMQDPDVLDLCTVVWAVVTYVVANLEDMLPRQGEYPSTLVPSSPPSASQAAPATTNMAAASLALVVATVGRLLN